MLNRIPALTVVLTLLAVGSLLVFLWFIQATAPPTREEMREALISQIEHLVPPASISCGLIPVPDSSADMRDCITRAIGNQEQFWVASRIPRDHGDAWLLLHRTENGLYRSFQLEYEPVEVTWAGIKTLEARYVVGPERYCSAVEVHSDEWSPVSCQ